MKKAGSAPAFVYPGAAGWRIRLPTGQTTSAQSLEEAAAALPAGASVHLALPCQATVLERMVLPSTDRDELAGMVELQLEKTLPYPVEEVSSDFNVIRQAENESTLVSVAANHTLLDQMCEPLRIKAFVPEKVTLYAQHVAASCDQRETVLCLWPEDGQTVLAICEGGKLGYAQVMPETDPTAVAQELPGLLLRAEMEGVPTSFDRIRIELGSGGLRDLVADLLAKPVDMFSFDAPLPAPSTNLVPSSWMDEMRKIERTGQLKNQLQTAAMVYLLIVAGAFLYLAWLKNKVRKIEAEIARTQPLVEFQTNMQAKWQQVAPAVDYRKYAVDVLNTLAQTRNGLVMFTAFEYDPNPPNNGFKLDLEAESSAKAYDFTDPLVKDPNLSMFNLTIGTPANIGDSSRVKLTISGKFKQ